MCLHQWRNENYIQEVVVGMHLGMHGIFLGDSNFSFLVFRFSGPHNNKEWPVTREEVETRKIGPLPSLPWPLGHVRLISFLGLVCAALLFFSTC